MDKDKLPKLKIEGFTNVTRQPERALWKHRAADIAQRFRVNRKESKPTEAVKQAKHHDVGAGYRRLLIKTGVCAAIAIVILAISSINTPTANNITQAIDSFYIYGSIMVKRKKLPTNKSEAFPSFYLFYFGL